jgi:hypothetical protein
MNTPARLIMAKPRSIKSVYWHPLIYPIKPPVLWEPAETQEIEEPYRFGKGYAVRLPLTRVALVVGTWRSRFSESQALTNAIRGRIMMEDEVDWDYVRFGGQENQAGTSED